MLVAQYQTHYVATIHVTSGRASRGRIIPVVRPRVVCCFFRRVPWFSSGFPRCLHSPALKDIMQNLWFWKGFSQLLSLGFCKCKASRWHATQHAFDSEQWGVASNQTGKNPGSEDEPNTSGGVHCNHTWSLSRWVHTRCRYECITYEHTCVYQIRACFRCAQYWSQHGK